MPQDPAGTPSPKKIKTPASNDGNGTTPAPPDTVPPAEQEAPAVEAIPTTAKGKGDEGGENTAQDEADGAKGVEPPSSCAPCPSSSEVNSPPPSKTEEQTAVESAAESAPVATTG